MGKIRIYTDHRENPWTMAQLEKLAGDIFGITFAVWKEAGYWPDHYTAHSLAVDGQIIANVSAFHTEWHLAGIRKKMVQLGCVMTHPEYRGQGWGGQLIEHVLKQKEKEAEGIYLFAHEGVYDFYRQYGFAPVVEREWVLQLTEGCNGAGQLSFLQVEEEADRQMILTLSRKRSLLASALHVENSGELLLFYLYNGYTGKCVYDAEEDIIAVYRQEGAVLHLDDLISLQPVDLSLLLKKMPIAGVKTVQFHFVPDRIECIHGDMKEVHVNHGMFCRPDIIPSGTFRYPSMART